MITITVCFCIISEETREKRNAPITLAVSPFKSSVRKPPPPPCFAPAGCHSSKASQPVRSWRWRSGAASAACKWTRPPTPQREGIRFPLTLPLWSLPFQIWSSQMVIMSLGGVSSAVELVWTEVWPRGTTDTKKCLHKLLNKHIDVVILEIMERDKRLFSLITSHYHSEHTAGATAVLPASRCWRQTGTDAVSSAGEA